MSRVLEIHPWKIIENGFTPATARASESLFSLGNGAMGGRANFEERYSGDSLQGNYIGGVFYPDRTRVGWWKVGYPEYFAKVLNSAFWPGVAVTVNGQELDLAQVYAADPGRLTGFYRELDMQTGLLTRRFTVRMEDDTILDVEVLRLVSMADYELGALSYRIAVRQAASPVELVLAPYIEADVRNEDANYDEKFWDFQGFSGDGEALTMRTRKTGFEVCWAQRTRFCSAGAVSREGPRTLHERIWESYTVTLSTGEQAALDKFVGVASSLNHALPELAGAATAVAVRAAEKGFMAVMREHAQAWRQKWEGCDIMIEGDDRAQQGIRFCIFQLLQTYTGRDSRLNVGPKGFTGEKYGGSTYWDTEAYCLPFYLCTSGEQVARQLLFYRYDQLDKAIENAEKLGFTGGAALYPMVTMTGEECHNEWEITFEEIHRNGSIAYAIYNYCRYTGTQDYLREGGLEVLVGIARFWAQRATFSAPKGQWVILGVTGPNEYENNVDNNWFSNYIAAWCMRYAAQAARTVQQQWPRDWQAIVAKTRLDPEREFALWEEIAANLYLPRGEERTPEAGILMQQEGYMNKEQRMAADIPPAERPINQHWSWDRILRSCFIKQADVLQGLYYFQEEFDRETLRRNFLFYEPRTVHESSLSPCVHSILAARLGMDERAYELYLRASRLDLDDYNREVDEGLHITSMAGSWLSVVEGFGGVRVGGSGILGADPRLPAGWQRMEFKLRYRGAILSFTITATELRVRTDNDTATRIEVCGTEYEVGPSESVIELKKS